MVSKCSDKTRSEGSPKCSSSKEIDKWIEYKHFHFMSFHTEFNNPTEYTRPLEAHLDTFKLPKWSIKKGLST